MLTIAQDLWPHDKLGVFTIFVLIGVPALFLIVPNTGSELYHLAALVGIVMMVRRSAVAPRPFVAEEKLASFGYAAFAVTVLISLASRGASYDAVRELDVLLRPLWAIPILYLFIRSRPPEGVLWVGMSLGAILAGLNAIFEIAMVDRYVRVEGATGPITYGNAALVMGVIAALGVPYFRRLGPLYVLIPAVALLLGLLACFLSGTRGAWVGIPALVLLLIWNYWQPMYRRFAIGGVLIFAGIVSVAVLLPQTGVLDRIETAVFQVSLYLQEPANPDGNAVSARFELWRAAWDMFTNRPILGGGIGDSYKVFVQEGVAAGDYHPIIAGQSLAHNVFLDVLAMRGLIGFAGLLALWLSLGYIFLTAAKESNAGIRGLGIAGLALVLSYALSGLTHSVMDYGRPLAFFCLYSAFIVHLIAQARLQLEPQLSEI